MKKENKIKLFLDSGAFSAKTQQVEINIQEYIAFIKKHEHLLEVYANLDVIGSAEGTWENQKIMEAAGLNPLPVFHYGEDMKWLQRYLKKGYPYIALGGMVKTPRLIQWLDGVWDNFLTDDSGMPVCKVHGFGLTSLTLMMRYPWYSVDSTSWVVTGRMGSVYVPRYRDGKWIYNENSWKISVSSQSPDKKDAGQHFDTMTLGEKKIITQYLSEKGYVIGKSEFKMESQTYELKENERWAQKKPIDKKEERRVEILLEEGVSNRYQLRDELNIIYFLDLEKNMKPWPWKFELQTGMKSLI